MYVMALQQSDPRDQSWKIILNCAADSTQKMMNVNRTPNKNK